MILCRLNYSKYSKYASIESDCLHFRYLDDLYANMEVQSSRFIMGWTVAVGMVTSLPFLVFSGPITDSIGHMNVIVIGNYNIGHHIIISIMNITQNESIDIHICYFFLIL